MIRRRTFLEAGTALLTAAALRPRLSRATDEAARPRLPLPTPAQLAWQEAEVVAMLCTDPRICYQEKPQLGNIHNVCRGEEKAREYASAFNPVKLDTDQWIHTAKEMGATAAVFVAKHEVGFCLWQSDANPYCLKMLEWRGGKGDITRDFFDSCRKHGIQPGVFTTTRFDNPVTAICSSCGWTAAHAPPRRAGRTCCQSSRSTNPSRPSSITPTTAATSAGAATRTAWSAIRAGPPCSTRAR